MFSLANVFDFFAHKLTGLRGRTLTLTRGFPRALYGSLFRHRMFSFGVHLMPYVGPGKQTKREHKS
jgi:hypothetical protein